MKWHVKAQIECSYVNCPERANGETEHKLGFLGDVQIIGLTLEPGWTFVKDAWGGLCPKHSEKNATKPPLDPVHYAAGRSAGSIFTEEEQLAGYSAPGWYFRTPFEDVHGPYLTEWQAIEAFRKYVP